MKGVANHLTKCFLAGIVALLPVGGLVLSVWYLETTLAEAWLARQDYYIPGMGLLAAVVIIYVIGLVVTTFLGRWLFSRVDRLLAGVPLVGHLYQTIKQILGYGEGDEAIFQRVVMVPRRDGEGDEYGLVTNRLLEEDGTTREVVFVPGSPNPTVGRLLLLDPDDIRPSDLTVNEAFKALVSVGKATSDEDDEGVNDI